MVNSEFTYQKAFEFSSAAMSISSISSGKYLMVNKSFELLTGFKAEYVIGKTSVELGLIPNNEFREEFIINVVRSGKTLSQQQTLRTKRGDYRRILFTATRMQDNPDLLISSATDIEELSRLRDYMQRELNNREARLADNLNFQSAVLAAIPDLVFIIDEYGYIYYCNTSTLDEIYITPERIRQKKLEGLLPEPAFSLIMHSIVEASEQGFSTNNHYYLDYPEGRRYFELSVAKIEDDSGKYVAVARDITAKEEYAAQLAASEEKFRSIFRGSSSAMLIVDTETGKIVDANASACHYYGYTCEEICEKSIFELDSESHQNTAERLEKLVNDKQGIVFTQNRMKDGTLRWLEIHTNVVSIDGRAVLFAIIHDITDKTIAENELAIKEKLLESVIDGSDAGTWIWNIQTGALVINERWAEIVGFKLAELDPISIKTWEVFCHPEDIPASYQAIEKHLDGTLGCYESEVRMLHKDGHFVWVLDRGKVIERDEQGNPRILAGTHIDITKRKKAELLLKHRIDVERLVSDIAVMFRRSAMDDLEAYITYALKMIGQESDVDRCYLFLFNDDTLTMTNTHEWCAEGVEPQKDMLVDLPVSIFPWWMEKLKNIETIHVPDVDKMPEEAIEEKQILKEQDILSVLVLPLVHQDILMGFVGVDSVRIHKTWLDEDIHLLEQVADVFANSIVAMNTHKDLLKAKNRAEESDAIKAKILANINHEIRTPLNGLTYFLDLLDVNMLPPEFSRYLDYIKLSTQNLASIVDDILSFKRLESLEIERHYDQIHLKTLLDSVVSSIILETIRKGLAVKMSFEHNAKQEFISDNATLKQIVMILLSNAVKFTHKGSIRIVATVLEGENPQLYIQVQDTGCGIKPEHQSQIFDEFFQAEEFITREYGGTGMGLPLAKRLVETLNGKVFLESSSPEGSRFGIQVPIQISEATPTTSASTTSTERKLKVLVVEDDEMILKMMTILLSRKGFDVVTAINGKLGYEAYLQNAVDVILMDIQMPVMNGITATEQIRKHESAIKIHTPIIAVTAHVGKDEYDICIQSGMDDVVHKPADIEVLVAKIKEFAK